MKNRILTFFSLLIAIVAIPAFADTATSTGTGPGIMSDTVTTHTGANANATGDTSAATHNMAGMTGTDKQALDMQLGKGACSTDVQQFCSDVNPGQGRIAACLHSHNDQISNPCSTQMKTAMTEFRAMRKDCKADVAKFCGEAQAGRGAVISCLKQHEDQLSSSCKSDEMSIAQSQSAS